MKKEKSSLRFMDVNDILMEAGLNYDLNNKQVEKTVLEITLKDENGERETIRLTMTSENVKLEDTNNE